MDTIRRVLLYNGYPVKTVMNITDVGHLTDDDDTGEDKVESAARLENKQPLQIAHEYTQLFFDDYKKLNILPVENVVIATEHINDMIKFIEGLINNGYAYHVDGDVYFDIEKYNSEYGYGKLSGSKVQEKIAGARVEVDSKKKNPQDFALWIRAAENHIMKWESPWGVGYPGWHIECSTMGRKYLGDKFDIHTGGVDHAALHHENEIAQTQALTGCVQANFWMHCEFLKVDGGKMSKSIENTYTIADLEDKGFSAEDFRYFILNANFRKSQNFTFEALQSAKTTLNNMIEILKKRSEENPSNAKTIKAYRDRFIKAVNNDLGIPESLAVLWDMLKNETGYSVYKSALEFDQVLGLNIAQLVQNFSKRVDIADEIPKDILELAKKRWNAKKNKEFDKSDEIRESLLKQGYLIEDKKNDYDIIKVKK